MIDVNVAYRQIHLKPVQEFYMEHILWEWKEEYESLKPSNCLWQAELSTDHSTAIILLICLALKGLGTNKEGVNNAVYTETALLIDLVCIPECWL